MQRKQRVKAKAKGKKKEKAKEKEKVKPLKVKENKEENLKEKPKIKMHKEQRKIVLIGCIEECVLVAPNAATCTTKARKEVVLDDLTAQEDPRLQDSESRVRSPEGENLRLDFLIDHLVNIGCKGNARKEISATIFM